MDPDLAIQQILKSQSSIQYLPLVQTHLCHSPCTLQIESAQLAINIRHKNPAFQHKKKNPT